MLNTLQYRLLLALGAACLLLVLTAVGLFFTNRGLQGQLAERAQYIQQAQSIGGVYQEVVKALANLAIERQDEELRGLLAKEGINITPRSKP